MTALPFVTSEIREGIAWVRLHRPPFNAINPALVVALEKVVESALANQEVRGLVLLGSGKCFAAGADLAYFNRQVAAKDWHRIEQFSRSLHLLCNLLANGSKPVVAAIRGAALGAGMELALACNKVVASRTTTLALPETGLGICPGAGGTQRTPRRIGYGLGKWLVYTGHMLSVPEALRIGLIDTCVDDQDLEAAAVAELNRLNAATSSQDLAGNLSQSDQQLAEVFAEYSVTALLGLAERDQIPDSWDMRTRRAVKKLPSRSRHALMLTEELIDRGQSMALPDALQLEVAAQRKMFEHPDARHRLAAALAMQLAKGA